MRPGQVLLRQAHDDVVFDPTPLRSGLAVYHVPFDELTGRPRTEQVLRNSVLAGERIAVSGVSGVGKSSLIHHVLGPADTVLAPFRVPVEAEDDEVAQEPAAFCRHVIRTVSRQLRDAAEISVDERRALLEASGSSLSLQRGRTNGKSGRVSGWMLDAELRHEAQSIIDTGVDLSGEEAVAVAARLLELVAAAGRQPVLIIDDSDAWLARPGGRDRSELVAPFFGRVLRTVAEELPAPLVVAVHDHYRQQEGYPVATGYLSRDVAVPRLPETAALAQVLAARLRFHEEWSLDELVGQDALDALWRHYVSGDGNLRRCMLNAHTALQVAADADADAIGVHHVEAALARFS